MFKKKDLSLNRVIKVVCYDGYIKIRYFSNWRCQTELFKTYQETKYSFLSALQCQGLFMFSDIKINLN